MVGFHRVVLALGALAMTPAVQAAPSFKSMRVAAWDYTLSDPRTTPLAQCPFDLVALQADTGKFVSRCQGCAPGDAYPDTGTIHMTDYHGASWSKWIVHVLPNNKVALQCSDTLRYLARCNKCHRAALDPDGTFVFVENLKNAPYAQWSVVDLGNNKVALQADSGCYLARCLGCVSGGTTPDFAFVQEPNPGNAWAQFTVVCAST